MVRRLGRFWMFLYLGGPYGPRERSIGFQPVLFELFIVPRPAPGLTSLLILIHVQVPSLAPVRQIEATPPSESSSSGVACQGQNLDEASYNKLALMGFNPGLNPAARFGAKNRPNPSLS
jgi:hypothetical protein